MKSSLVLNSMPTSTYMAILDEKGDSERVTSHMDIFDEMSIDFIQEKRQVIENSRICVIDTNMPEEPIHYVLDSFSNTEFFLDTVSTTKAKKIISKIGRFPHTIKTKQD